MKFSEYILFVYSYQLTAIAEFSTHKIPSQTYLYKAHDEVSLLHLPTMHALKCHVSEIKLQKPTKYGEIAL